MAESVNKSGTTFLQTSGWPAERWAGAVVIFALLMLIVIRRGFRGVNVLGASVSVK